MPKENTHLWFANEVLQSYPDHQLVRDVSGHIGRFYLGSFIPDTFFYASTERLVGISETLHGKNNTPTNEAVITVLDHAGGMHDIAFILGYVTHCALDIVFHPVINAIAGDYYDEDPAQRSRSVYLHRWIETCLDDRLGNRLRIYRLTRPALVKDLAYEDFIVSKFHAPSTALRRTLSRQLLFNRLFASRRAYAVFKLLHGLGALRSRELLSLFYGDVKNGCEGLGEPTACFGVQTGAEFLPPDPDILFSRARGKALAMMRAAYGFAKGSVSEEQLLEAIPGENLGTGELPSRLGRS